MSRRAAGGTRVLVVGYHRVVPDFDQLRGRVIPALLTSIPTFERQLAMLGRFYRFVPLGDALAVLEGRSGSDRDLCVITFDDGYADFAAHALPVLRRLGIPATLYVATGHIGSSTPLLHDRLYGLLTAAEEAGLSGSAVRAAREIEPALGDALRRDAATAAEQVLAGWRRATCLQLAEALELVLGADTAAALAVSPLLSWDELRAVHAAGVGIGAHTVDHVSLPNESTAEVWSQVRSSRERLERELGAPVVDFAYPHGLYSPRVVRAVAAAGYRGAVTTEDRLNRRGEDPFLVRRKVVWELTSRGVRGFSPAVAACSLGQTFGALGLSSWLTGARRDQDARTTRDQTRASRRAPDEA